MNSHYETLGISRAATAQQIRSAYRKLVLKHHPDRSSDPNAAAKFRQIVEAYEVLIDADLRSAYDTSLAVRATVREQIERPAPRPRQPAPAAPPAPSQKEAILALQELLNKGRLGDAEKLAVTLKSKYPREPLPYSVLGDLARSRGDLRSAMLLYSHAVQMDPRNPSFLRKYEELFRQTTSSSGQPMLRPQPALLLVLGFVWVALFVALALTAKAKPIFAEFAVISTWNLPLLLVLFFGGVVTGICLAIGRWIDRFEVVATATIGKISPAVALCTIAVFNLWAAAGLYAALGVYQRTLNFSTTRLLAASGAFTLAAGLAATLGGVVDLLQVAIWGGNLVYLGGVCGWIVADAMRPGV